MSESTKLSPWLGALEFLYEKGLSIHQSSMLKKQFVNTNPSTKIISVGNLTWGGSGKTPLCIKLAQGLQDLGSSAAILMRGYGNDEEFEYKETLEGVPIGVGKNRARSLQKVISHKQVDFVIMDDGFSHLKMARDCDILAVNATNPFGNGHLIPAGILRERPESMSRADVIVVTQSVLGRRNLVWLKQKIRQLNRNASIFEADHQPAELFELSNKEKVEFETIKNKRVLSLSAIEDPFSFENTITRIGSNVVAAARYQDHHSFKKSDLKKVFRLCEKEHADYIITTYKDYQRLKKFKFTSKDIPAPLLVLKIQLRLDHEEKFVEECIRIARSSRAVQS